MLRAVAALFQPALPEYTECGAGAAGDCSFGARFCMKDYHRTMLLLLLLLMTMMTMMMMMTMPMSMQTNTAPAAVLARPHPIQRVPPPPHLSHVRPIT